ncbi:hydroxyisourate hydrolase [Bacillus sp. AK128]
MTHSLSTHVLDLSIGKPGYGMFVELWKQVNHQFEFIQKACTNKDGRLNEPLLKGDTMELGIYELRFYVGDYYRLKGEMTEGLFLECVPIRFCISDLQSSYHVPLLISPGGYSTYRGS